MEEEEQDEEEEEEEKDKEKDGEGDATQNKERLLPERRSRRLKSEVKCKAASKRSAARPLCSS